VNATKKCPGEGFRCPGRRHQDGCGGEDEGGKVFDVCEPATMAAVNPNGIVRSDYPLVADQRTGFAF
jgi:hypothetical protein